jgi:threonine aldolase
VGALVGGSKDFIGEAWRLRKALGGGMRQAGVLAAAALVGLAEAEEVLPRDHENAQRFAKGAWKDPPLSLLLPPTWA